MKGKFKAFVGKCIDLAIIMLSEINQTEEGYISYGLPYMRTSKIIKKNLKSKMKRAGNREGDFLEMGEKFWEERQRKEIKINKI